ncbi:hypothetical protein [Pseudarthrobacter sulfonivorans]|uniref:hypothetical protein n=1 Tax=Pseudarthrobacter sulfonivorans TaxID=121292 RepID=UPI002859CCB5|nr:hypothetical protein [Pseudarthrobacter sulfonivorans]MDR6415645.1 hypothetical protein [Pseudarthrobacter sulfonivorans]
MNKAIPATAVAAALLLTGCAASSSPVDTALAAPSGTTAASQTAAAPESLPAATSGADKTADFTTANAGAAWVGEIKSATATEPGRMKIETSIVDPRGADGSEPARTAIAICEAAVAIFGPSYVAVMEDDGTHFALFGHPSVPAGACTEV